VTLRAARERAARRIGAVRAATLPVLVVLAVAIVLAPSWNSRLPNVWYDFCQLVSPRPIQSMPATIVEVDHKSLAALGQWPWPRFLLAQLIDEIARNRPAAIGIDILMPEPDGLSPERLLSRVRNTDPELLRRLAELPGNDALLALALQASPSVLAVAGVFEPTGAALAAAPFQVSARGAAPSPDELSVPRFVGTVTSLPEIDRAAHGRGLISVESAGGVFRRLPLVGNIGGTLVPALSVELLRVALGAPAVRLYTAGTDVEAIGVGDFVAPTESDGAVAVWFSPHNTDRFVSAIDVLDGKVDKTQIEQKLVLIGLTGLGMIEDKMTPLGMSMPGVEIHAQLIENLFDGTMLKRPAWAPAIEALAFLLLGALLIVVTPLWKPRDAALVAVGSVAALFALSYAAFRLQRLLFDAATPSLCLAVLFGVLVVLTLADANLQRRALERVVQKQREASARIAGELGAATRIQMATLPRAEALASDPRMDLAATMVPAREVGGDLYDFFMLDDRRLFFLVGDVAGKGLSASIFQAVSKALYKSTTLRASNADVGELMTAANAEVARDNPEMLFVTAFAGILDLDTGELGYCNAGHDNPYLVRTADATLHRLADGDGPPLCVMDDFPYTGAEIALAAGDWLCVVTDGVTEAQPADGQLYGTERVEATLLREAGAGSTAGALVDALRADVDRFADGAEPADDLTVLVLRWNGPRAQSDAEDAADAS
jgi:serine phosphatase RsbU (regulator of sigma subunit)/CHASE2 domain-containing sensor protein